GGSQIHDRARARAGECRPQSSGSQMDPLDILGTYPVHAGIHAAAQPAGPAGKNDSAAAAAGNQRTCVADESGIPDRALGGDGELPDSGGDGVCAEVPGELVGAPTNDVGIE